MAFFLIPLAVLVIIFLLSGVMVVQQQTAYVIERLGRFARVCNAGLNFKIPVIEKVAARVDLRILQSSFAISAKTSDNVTIGMQVAVQYQVDVNSGADGVANAFYRLSSPEVQMQSYIIDALRSAIPSYTLDEAYAAKDDIAQLVQMQVSQKMVEYGYVVISTLITDIELPHDVEQSMNRINSAQREQVAAKALAEAERIKVVTEARAEAEAMEQAGRGIAAQRKAIADGIAESLDAIKESGVSTQEANLLFLFTQWTDMMSGFSKSGRASTVVLPSSFQESAGMFEQMLVAKEAPTKSDWNIPRA